MSLEGTTAEERLVALERRQRATLRVALAALALGLFLLLVQVFEAIAPPPPTVAADAFVLRDLNGVERARLEQRGEKPPALELCDGMGRTRLSLSVAPDGAPSILLRDEGGQVRAGLALLPDQRPQFALVGEGGPPRVQLGLSGAGAEGPGWAGRIVLRDAAGEVRFEAP